MTPWRRLTTLGDTLEKVRLAFQGPEGVKPNQASRHERSHLRFLPRFFPISFHRFGDCEWLLAPRTCCVQDNV